MDTKYKGSTNKETWLVKQQTFFCDADIRTALHEIVEELRSIDADDEIEPWPLLVLLGDWMKDVHYNYMYRMTMKLHPYVKGFLADDKINWREIASGYEELIKEAVVYGKDLL